MSDPAYPPPPQYPPQQGYAQGPPVYGQPPPPSYGQAVTAQPCPVTTVVAAGGGKPVFRDVPVTMTCPHCHQQVTTKTQHHVGTMTWCAAGMCCLFGGWLGCFLIPFFINGAKDVEHVCTNPTCEKAVGRWNRM